MLSKASTQSIAAFPCSCFSCCICVLMLITQTTRFGKAGKPLIRERCNRWLWIMLWAMKTTVASPRVSDQGWGWTSSWQIRLFGAALGISAVYKAWQVLGGKCHPPNAEIDFRNMQFSIIRLWGRPCNCSSISQHSKRIHSPHPRYTLLITTLSISCNLAICRFKRPTPPNRKAYIFTYRLQ